MAPTRRPRVDRLRGGDRMQWEADTGAFPQHIGAILVLGESDHGADDWAQHLAPRLGTVPALGRRPVRPPVGGGPWVWADDDRAADRHVTVIRLPDADPATVLRYAIRGTAIRLPADRSPWRAGVLTGPDGDVVAIVLVLHHVLADGLSGLAVLGSLVDGVPAGDPLAPARPVPEWPVLAADAWADRWAALRRAPAVLADLPGARQEMGGRRPRAPRTSLNRVTGPRRDIAVTRCDLASARAVAHRHGGSVNDLLLVAVASVLRRLAAERGEDLREVVVSVPVAVTDPAVRDRVGNAVGSIPMPVPAVGDAASRIAVVAAARRQRLSAQHGRSLSLVLVAFRALATVGLVDRFATHQRQVNTLVTNVRGPDRPVSVLGAQVRRIVPIVPNQGNVAVSFAALSYAGDLVVTTSTDPEACGPARYVADLLDHELADILTQPAR